MERKELYKRLRIGFLRTPDPSKEQLDELQALLETLPIEVSLHGLKFARKRWLREQHGTGRLGGRPSKVREQTRFLEPKQAADRLVNWKEVTKSYLRQGYNRMTIARIKKELIRISQQTD
jgi:hypothetical protein